MTPVVRLAPQRARPIWCGHACVWADLIASHDEGLKPGDPVEIVDDRDRHVDVGVWNGAPRLRAIALGAPGSDPEVWRSAAPWIARADEAVQRRLREDGSLPTWVRVINDAGDGLYGIVADRFDDTVLIRATAPGTATHLGAIAARLRALVASHAVDLRVYVVRPDGMPQDAGLASVRDGALHEGLPPSVAIDGVRIDIGAVGVMPDPARRDVAASVVAVTRPGASVLVLTGDEVALTCALAARGRRVTKVVPTDEIAARLCAAGSKAMAGVEFVVGDATATLQRLQTRHVTFDCVIGDDTTFQGPETNARSGLKRLESRVAAMARVTAPDGRFVLTLDGRIPERELVLRVIAAGAARASRRARVLLVSGQPFDLPTPAAMPEFRRHETYVCGFYG